MAGRSASQGIHRHPPRPLNDELFGPEEMALLVDVQPMVEQVVGEYFRLSSFGPVRRCYEVVTLAGDPGCREDQAFAVLCRYDRSERIIEKRQRISRYYRVCLQDPNILWRSRQEPSVSLRALLICILTHELIHIVRFESFQICYDANEQDRNREEKSVHKLTNAVLETLRDAEIFKVLRGLSGTRVDVVQ